MNKLKSISTKNLYIKNDSENGIVSLNKNNLYNKII